MKKYDVIIIGGGAAGLTAAIYTGRKKLKTALITIDVGGQSMLTDRMENYPGFESISGPELMAKLQSQAGKFGTEFVMGEVIKINKKGDLFNVLLGNKKKYSSKAIILASGKTARMLGVPGEDKFLGKGVSTCATCDANFFHGKTVAVVGGGNSAFDAVELLNKFAKKIYLVHRSKKFRADEVTVDKVKKMKKVQILSNSFPMEIRGDKFVKGLVIKDKKGKKELKVDGVFVEIGYELKTDFLKGLVKRNRVGEIIIDDRSRTSLKGFFAAGDVTSVPYKQAIISAGEGAKAGLEAYKYIKGESTAIDWD